MDDAISREQVIKATWQDTGYTDPFNVMTAIRDRIKQLPPIQPEPHWIPVTERLPEEERECWITPKTTSKVYRGIFTRHYGERHRTGFICDDGFMWLNTALAWMYCEFPEPYKGVNT